MISGFKRVFKRLVKWYGNRTRLVAWLLAPKRYWKSGGLRFRWIQLTSELSELVVFARGVGLEVEAGVQYEGKTLTKTLAAPQRPGRFRFLFSQTALSHARTEALWEFSLRALTLPLPAELFVGTASTSIHKPLSTLLEQGYMLDKRGGLVESRAVNKVWIDTTLHVYSRAREYFRNVRGLNLFIIGGTLLGFARTGGVIDFDRDFDCAYLSGETEPEAVHAEFKAVILDLLERGEDIRLVRKGDRGLRRDYFQWFSDEGAKIDVFPAAFPGGTYRRPTFVVTDLTRDDFEPFFEGMFSGHPVLVPKNYEKKVEAVYGPGWRVPDPFWVKNTGQVIQEYRKAIQLNREDLLEIASKSRTEGERLKKVVDDVF